MIRDLWAVVPIKALDQAKSRLASVMERAGRRELVLAMLRHTLRALQDSDAVHGIAVIGRDSAVGEVACAHNATFLLEFGPPGLNRALEQAASHVSGLQGGGMLVIPGDLPYLRPASIRVLAQLAAANGVVIVPDHRGGGTNALLVAPPDLIPFHFGPDSFRKHLAAAVDIGVQPIVHYSADLVMDVDLPADLGRLTEDLRSYRLVEEL